MENKILSLCIPTNGISEWVIPVLESIYKQNVSLEVFEVIVTDNGTNEEFQKQMKNYSDNFENFIYRKNNSKGFLNQLESFKLANGEFIKFINHRMIILDTGIKNLIKYIKKYRDEKPVIYFSNGNITNNNEVICYDFDSFIKCMGYWSSWSAGVGIWRDDFKNLPVNLNYNCLFPHLTILFYYQNKEKYIINNYIYLKELQTDEIKKGKYDLFYAFSVEYMGILLDLLRSGAIQKNTFLFVKKEVTYLLVNFYIRYTIRKNPCSYTLKEAKESISIFGNWHIFQYRVFKIILLKIGKKMLKLFWRK